MYFIPSRIRELREFRNLSLDQIANKSGISKQVISTWETGACEPRISMLNKFAVALDVPFDFFFSDSETIVVQPNEVKGE